MPYDSVYLEKRPPGALRTVWRKFYGDTTAMIGLYGCAALALLCVFGGWFAPYGIDQQFLGYQLLPPSWSRYGEVSFFLGTDDLGRDVLSRLLSGAAPTFAITGTTGACIATSVSAACMAPCPPSTPAAPRGPPPVRGPPMASKTVTVGSAVGLHARPAAVIAAARRFRAGSAPPYVLPDGRTDAVPLPRRPKRRAARSGETHDDTRECPIHHRLVF